MAFPPSSPLPSTSSRLPPGCCSGKIPEMDSVVASVSGYVGAERFDLIKLINSSGGYFVGRLTRTATHLVCWTFQGDKYDTAKRMGITIVNHRWFEDCVKAGRRLPESPYTVLCGKAAGPLLLKELQLTASAAYYPKLKNLGSTKRCSDDNPNFSLSSFPNNAAATMVGLEMSDLLVEKMGRERAKLQKISYLGMGQEPKRKGKIKNNFEIHSQNGIQSNHLEITSKNTLSSPSSDKNLQVKTSLFFDMIPKERDKGKSKVSSVCKASPKCKTPRKFTKLSASRMDYAGQRKRKCSITFSCSILDYISSSDANDLEDDSSGPQKSIEGVVHTKIIRDAHNPAELLSSKDRGGTTVPEDIEDCSPAKTLKLKHVRSRRVRLSLAKRNPVKDRANHRLIKETVNQSSSTCISLPNEIDSEHFKHFPQIAAEEAIESTDKCKQEPGVLHCTNTCAKPGTCPDASQLCITIACVICHTEKISSAEGVLTCGHRFCFLCIKKWASEAVSKAPTCPLCKAPFDIITKRERRAQQDDLELCSQYDETLVMLGGDKSCGSDQLQPTSVSLSCVVCGNRDTEELLLTCNGCGCRCAHTFCLDPPLPPIPDAHWLCGRCTQRRRVDTTWWYQLHHFGTGMD